MEAHGGALGIRGNRTNIGGLALPGINGTNGSIYVQLPPPFIPPGDYQRYDLVPEDGDVMGGYYWNISQFIILQGRTVYIKNFTLLIKFCEYYC